MPRKYPSGAAKDRLRRERDEQERRAEALRRAPDEDAVPAEIRPDLARFHALGRPPADASATAEWAARVAGELLFETINDPVLTAPERRRTGADLIAKIGQVSQKSALQARVRQLEERLARDLAGAHASPAAPADGPADSNPTSKPKRALRAAGKAAR